jgi:hypothetical protein
MIMITFIGIMTVVTFFWVVFVSLASLAVYQEVRLLKHEMQRVKVDNTEGARIIYWPTPKK